MGESEHQEVEAEGPSPAAAAPMLGVDAGALSQGGRSPEAQRQMLLALQRSAGNRSVMRLLRTVAPPVVSGAAPPQGTAGGVTLVADSAEPGPGQMRLGSFLDQVRDRACATVEAALGSAWMRNGSCPWVEHWTDYYRSRSVTEVLEAVRRYAPETATVTDAGAAVTAICERIRSGITSWQASGALPPVHAPGDAGRAAQVSEATSPADAGARSLSRATRSWLARDAVDDPVTVTARLGAGRPLDGALRSRMSAALGADLGHVRVHQDPAAARVTQGLGATALAVGSHLAFSPGAYAPGTLIGDALIAHELAHVIQQAPGAAATGQTARLEADADHAAAGAMASLIGIESPLSRRPRLSTGLRVQRCDAPTTRVEQELEGEELRAAIAVNQLSLHASREPERGVTGLVVSYTIDSVEIATASGARRYHARQWNVFRPGQTHSRASVLEDPDGPLVVTMDQAGDWTVQAEVSIDAGHYVTLQSVQHVEDIDVVARDIERHEPTRDFDHTRALLETHRLGLAQNVARDQNFGGAYISLDTGENPIPTPAAPVTHRYTVHPDPLLPADAPRPVGYRWYAMPRGRGTGGLPILPGRQTTTYLGRPAYSLDSSSSTSFTYTGPGVWEIVCETLDREDRVQSTVRYVQAVLTADQQRDLERMTRFIGETGRLYGTLDTSRAIALRAVHVEGPTARVSELSLFVGPSAADAGEYRLLDLTYGARRTEYSGTSIGDAIDSFQSGNSYPEGRIVLSGDGVPERSLHSTGASTAQEVSGGFGWAALGLGILGGVALLTPAAPIAPFLFYAAAASGVAQGTLSLVDHLQQAQRDPIGIALDVATIATSIVLAGQGRMLQVAGTEGVFTIRGARYLVYTGFSLDVVQGVLISADSVRRIDEILAGPLPREQKLEAIIRILTMLAVQGAMIAYGARDIRGARGHIGEALGDAQLAGRLRPEIIGGLDALPEAVVRGLRGASAAEIEQVGRLASTNRGGAARLAARFPDDFAAIARSGRYSTLEEVAEELGRRHPIEHPELPAAEAEAAGHPNEPSGTAETSQERIGPGEEPIDAIVAEREMINAHGEPHEFHMTADGRLFRCSWRCEDFITNVRERAAALRRSLAIDSPERLIGTGITDDLHELQRRVQRKAAERARRAQTAARARTDERRAAVSDRNEQWATDTDESLMNRAEEIERRMSGLENRMGLQPHPDVAGAASPTTAAGLRSRYPDLLQDSEEMRAELVAIERAAGEPANAVDVSRRLAALEGRLAQSAEGLVPEMIAGARQLQTPLGNRTHQISIGGHRYQKCRASTAHHETISGGQAAAGFDQRTRDVIEHGREIGHTFAEDNFDASVADQLNRGLPAAEHVPVSGASRASHAEKQAAMAAPNEPIAVSLPMCFDCYAFFRSHARAMGRPQVVADPDVVRIFMPDGRVLSPSRFGTAPLQPRAVVPVGPTHQP